MFTDEAKLNRATHLVSIELCCVLSKVMFNRRTFPASYSSESHVECEIIQVMNLLPMAMLYRSLYNHQKMVSHT